MLDNEDAAFVTGLINSLIVATVVTVSVVFFSSLAGFAFAKLRFRGRNAMLLFILATMMVPTQLGIIPLYMMMAEFGWHEPAARPSSCRSWSARFGVFMMRQYASQAVPDELIEAARVDGCSHLPHLLERRAAGAAPGRRRCSACSPSWRPGTTSSGR